WVHVQLHQQKGMISLSPPTICNSAKVPAYGPQNDVTLKMPAFEWVLRKSTGISASLPDGHLVTFFQPYEML
ncbi:hypothetical protein, partial [Klebsiella pneumoniae]|uniref:hypothetical protein n=1 Tax=Klebsiella pneumoniae TaxID=573 RepID=UPI0007D6E836